jgi:hypothetical protein
MSQDPSFFFHLIHEKFIEAREKTQCSLDFFYDIGGLIIKLNFASKILIPHIIPAIEHLAVDGTPDPDLTICLCDSCSTNTGLPRPPWSWKESYLYHGEIEGYNNENIKTGFHNEGCGLSLLNVKEKKAIYWVTDGGEIPLYQLAAPLVPILPWFMREHARHFVHAAAVGRKDGGVLLTGQGGIGKSTAALSCLDSNLFYAGDDLVIVENKPAPYVYSIYSSAKLSPDMIQKMVHLKGVEMKEVLTEKQKRLIILHEKFKNKLIKGFPIKAIFVPNVVNEKNTTVEETSKANALKAVFPTTVFRFAGSGQNEFKILADLVRVLPCYILNTGRDLEDIPKVISEFLEKRTS